MTWQTFFIALGLVFVLEGLFYAVAPSQVQAWMRAFSNYSLEKLRLFGLVALLAGTLIIWLALG